MSAVRGGLQRYPGFGTVTWLCLAMLYAPMLVIAIYSFNAIRSITTWGGFSLDWYVKALNNPLIQSAILNSLIIAVGAAVVSTLIAVAAAIAMVRGRRLRGSGIAFAAINLPLMVPEIVSAVASLVFFISIGIQLGLTSILIAHIVFCIPFAYMPIAARLQGIEAFYEEAARDLYASRWQAFTTVLLPMMLPGVISGFVLAFIVSLDDFIITSMVAGPGSSTLPLAIYGMVRTGFTPEINAISTMMLVVSILLVSASYLFGRWGGQGQSA